MSATETYEGLDPISGRAVRVYVREERVDHVQVIDSSSDLPWITPGLVDLQVNGYGGVDANSPETTAEDIVRLTRILAARGTGTWLPTIITASAEQIESRLQLLAEARAVDPMTARAVPCAHLEGPFISPEDGPRGAHDREHVREISIEEVRRWQEIFPIGYVTLSPHWPDSPAKIAQLRRLGIRVAIGHTHASADEVAAASAAGCTLSTHLGNGVRAELSRHPNLLWSQIADPTLDAGLIADGHHLPMSVLETVIRAKGIDHCFLVSDSVALGGSPAGRYRAVVGGEVTLSEDNRLSLVEDPRLLAGSAVSLADCVRAAYRHAALSLADVFTMATRVPGRILGEFVGSARYGVLTPGAGPDLVLWDGQLAPILTTGSGLD